jgi:hypothetical protein
LIDLRSGGIARSLAEAAEVVRARIVPARVVGGFCRRPFGLAPAGAAGKQADNRSRLLHVSSSGAVAARAATVDQPINTLETAD